MFLLFSKKNLGPECDDERKKVGVKWIFDQSLQRESVSNSGEVAAEGTSERWHSRQRIVHNRSHATLAFCARDGEDQT